jgi:hypothetical protein
MVMLATLLTIVAVLSAPGGIYGSVLAVAAMRAWVHRARVRSRRGKIMITGGSGTRWLVRLSVPRRGGVRPWGAARRAFERDLAGQESAVVAGPQIEAETRRGREYVRVTVVMTVSAADVGAAAAAGWGVFRRAADGDPGGWDMAAASAEVRPESV